jgi:hypothetical protein
MCSLYTKNQAAIRHLPRDSAGSEGRLRLLALSLCFLLGACSTDIENLAATNSDPPDPAKVLASLKNIATAAKLQEPVEVSAPIKAPANSSIPWIICLRSGATEASRRFTYSLFFKNNDLKDYRLSAIIEECGVQPYGPLK